MFKWYFEDLFIENSLLFWISMGVILLIILTTIYFVHKELKENSHVNK